MFWDYGNPASSGAAAKPNGSAAAAHGQRVNGAQGASAGSGVGREKQDSSASRQRSKPADDEPFSGTPMSPEFEVRPRSPCYIQQYARGRHSYSDPLMTSAPK